MKPNPLFFTVLAVTFAVFAANPAGAIPRTYVSSLGSGVACTRAAPCIDFKTAHDATDPGGEIACLDAGNYVGNMTVAITKSITIDCTGTASTAVVLQPQGFSINTPGITVRIRGLTILGLGPGIDTGIQFVNGAALFIENCVIDGFTRFNARAVRFSPAAGVTAKLFILDSILTNNISTDFQTGSAVEISPADTGSALVFMDGVRAENNFRGIVVSGPKAGLAAVQIRNSVFANGVEEGLFLTAPNTGGVLSVTLDRSSVLLNKVSGATVEGPGFLIVAKSTSNSNNGAFFAAFGAHILSYQDNMLDDLDATQPTGVLSRK